MPEFALLPHACRRETINQVALSLQLVTGLLLSVLVRMSHSVPRTGSSPPLRPLKLSLPKTGRHLCWGQGELWRLQAKYMETSRQPGTRLQGFCLQGAGKAPVLKDPLKKKQTGLLGVTQVVQKFITLKPGPSFLKGRPINLLQNVLPAYPDCFSLPACTTHRQTPLPFLLPWSPLHLTSCCDPGNFTCSPCLTDQPALLQRPDAAGESAGFRDW